MKALIADDHFLVRDGLKQIINKIDEISLIDEAVNGHEALQKIEKTNYDIVILDISMPDISGLDILKTLKDKNAKVRTLVLSIHPQEQYAIRVLKLGASGFLCKNSLYEELETAIKTILSGERYISRELSEKILFDKKDSHQISPHEKLSEREFQIMCLLAQGKSVKEIAEKLFISDKTVSTHRVRILEKMDLKKNAELTNYAIRNELIE